jgi:PST family polysaccharide transporter
MGFRGAATCICALLSIATAKLLRPGEELTLAIVIVFGIGCIGQSLESGEILFQARTDMRRLIIPRLGLFLVMNTLKVVLILMGMTVLWFAVLTALEMILSGLLTCLMVSRALDPGERLRFEWARGCRLLQESWPLAVASFMVIVYMKVGQILLGSLLGDAAVGIYSAAIRVPEATNFLPMVLASSMLPGLVKSRERSPAEYEQALLRYFRINILIAFAICLPLSLGAPWIIHFLFHKNYAAAAPIMAVYTWSMLPIFLGVSRGQHLLNEKRTGYLLFFSVFGLIINLACNFFLIPRIGAMGAAVATVASQTCSAFLASFLLPYTRRLACQQSLALITPWLALRHGPIPKCSSP